jgi:hypothetical protein
MTPQSLFCCSCRIREYCEEHNGTDRPPCGTPAPTTSFEVDKFSIHVNSIPNYDTLSYTIEQHLNDRKLTALNIINIQNNGDYITIWYRKEN